MPALSPHEIFTHMPAANAGELLAYLYEKEKPYYRAAVETLAKQRNLRPVFIERKPRAERFPWLHAALARKTNDAVGAQLLQIWLMGAHANLLCTFLDALEISHEADGSIPQLPEAPAKEKIATAVESLLAQFDPALVKIYLHAFQALDEKGGWPALGELLESDARLALAS